jgi:nucleoid-associated protein Lsr2
MRKTVVVCDLCGENPREGVAVVDIIVNGKNVSADVCSEHLDVLRGLPASGKARTTRRAKVKSGKPPARATRQSYPVRTDGPDRGRQPGSRRERQARLAQARAWGRAQGRDISERGRLPVGLLEEFEAVSH